MLLFYTAGKNRVLFGFICLKNIVTTLPCCSFGRVNRQNCLCGHFSNRFNLLGYSRRSRYISLPKNNVPRRKIPSQIFTAAILFVNVYFVGNFLKVFIVIIHHVSLNVFGRTRFRDADPNSS